MVRLLSGGALFRLDRQSLIILLVHSPNATLTSLELGQKKKKKKKSPLKRGVRLWEVKNVVFVCNLYVCM